MRVVRSLSCAALLVGCTDAAPPADGGMDASDATTCTSAPTELTLGTSSDGAVANFRPLADGDPVFLVLGPQGGQHVWTALRGRGLDPTLPRFEMRMYRVTDDTLIGRLRIRLPMSPVASDPTLLALPPQTLQIEDRAYCTVLGAQVRIEVDFDDQNGRCVTLRRTVLLQDLDPATPEFNALAWRRCCSERLPRCYAPDAGGPIDADTDAGAGID